MARKSTIFGFSIPFVFVTFLQILLPYSGLGKVILNISFGWPFLGLALINVLLFAVPMCIGLGRMVKSGVKANSQKENQKKEKELKELLQGDNIGKSKMPAWARIGIAICIGMIAGSVLGFILNRIIT